jgi:hypothetical protein
MDVPEREADRRAALPVERVIAALPESTEGDRFPCP